MAVGVNRWKAGGALEGRKGRYDKNDINDKSPPRPLPLVVFVVYVVGRGTWAGIWTLRKRAKPCCLAALAWVESPPESSVGDRMRVGVKKATRTAEETGGTNG